MESRSHDVRPLSEQLDRRGGLEAEKEIDSNGEIPESVFESLRQDHSKIGRGRTVTVDVPGFHGNLRVRYKWVERKELTRRGRRLAKKVSDPDTLDILAACDTLVTTCQEILVVADDEEKSLGDPPVTFSNYEGLLKHLNISADTAREAVQIVFNNDYALVKTAIGISRWLEDTSREVDIESLGL